MTGQSVGSDASRLSCFLFRPRKSCEKHRKRSYTNASNASIIRTSRVSQTPPQTPPPYFYQWVSHGKKWSWRNRLQMAHVHFRSRKRVHTRLCSKDRTRGHTRRNTGVSDGGGITTLSALCVLLKRWMAACQKGCSVSGRSDTLIREPLQCLQENELTECQGTGYLPFTIRSLRCK